MLFLFFLIFCYSILFGEIKSVKTWDPYMTIAVITVEPADKISFVYNCMQTRLIGVNTMENDPLASFVCQDRW